MYLIGVNCFDFHSFIISRLVILLVNLQALKNKNRCCVIHTMTNLTVSLWRISMNNIKIFHCVNDVIIYKEFDASHNRKRHLTDTDSRKNIPSFLTSFFPCFNKSTHCHYCISVEVSISGAGKTNSVIINLGHLLICYGS